MGRLGLPTHNSKLKPSVFLHWLAGTPAGRRRRTTFLFFCQRHPLISFAVLARARVLLDTQYTHVLLLCTFVFARVTFCCLRLPLLLLICGDLFGGETDARLYTNN